jgi:hypothetical protein
VDEPCLSRLAFVARDPFFGAAFFGAAGFFNFDVFPGFAFFLAKTPS